MLGLFTDTSCLSPKSTNPPSDCGATFRSTRHEVQFLRHQLQIPRQVWERCSGPQGFAHGRIISRDAARKNTTLALIQPRVGGCP